MRRDRAEWPVRLLRSLATAVVAGLSGLAVHSALMLAKDVLRILPGFQPYEDFQRLLGGWAGGQLSSLLPYLTGAMIWGFLYARLHDHMPGRRFWVKGLSFALLAWSVMATGFFLLAGHGLFGLRLGYGLWPALFMFPMLGAFSLVLSFTHTRLRAAIHPCANGKSLGKTRQGKGSSHERSHASRAERARPEVGGLGDGGLLLLRNGRRALHRFGDGDR